ncbi:probable ATP-dependent RNA helicase DHX58 [Anneissia japonica]|uniref:probable ATP-dependent RNA helicase DHX58 n=1 Tax=Anneissia japonica TaxID=1529436 RepID=UPI001425B8A5|nr:probable ATP-dependent RNA helicase DHX58 [Anneissia japonica]
MAEDGAYTAAFNEKFREEFVKCVDVMDFIVALGNTLTSSDEEKIKAVFKTEGNTSAAVCLCERLFRRPDWKDNIVKALRSDEIKQDDLANRMKKEFKAIKSSYAMAEDGAYTAAFNEKFREEFVKCVDVMDFIVALGNTLTSSDEEKIKAVYKTEGNTSAAVCLCERLFRRPDWKDNIVKALRSDEIKQVDLANRMKKEFKAIKSSYESINLSPNSSSHADASNLNVDQNMQLPQTPQGTPHININLSFYQGARPKENQLVFGYTSPTSANSAVFGGSRLATNFSNAVTAFPEKDMNIIPLKKYEEQLVADALDGKQKNVLIIVPNGDETRSRIPAHICTTHLQNPGEDCVKKPKAVCLTTTNTNWFGSLRSTIKIESILDDQKNITAECLKDNDVILSTPEIFKKALNSKALTFKDLTLLILDDCHLSSQTHHPYRSIMESYLKEKLAANSAMTQVVGLTTRESLQNQGDMKEAADNLSNLMGALDAMCISAVTEESTKEELYKQIYPKISNSSVVGRRQDNTFCSVISEMMSKIEQKLDMNTEPSQRYSEEYGNRILELSKQEEEKQDKKIENERSVLLKHLSIYNEVLQMNEKMRTKDAFALLKIFYREHGDDNEWLDDLYQEHSSELHKLSREGDGKYENPRLAHLKREILKKSGGDFKAIIVSEHRQVREALYDWLKKSPDFKNLTTKSLSITDKSSEIESFNAEQRLLLLSSTELKDAKLTGVKMAVIFSSTKDGIHIFQSEDDATKELLDLVAELQFNEVVKSLQDLPESVKEKSNLNKKLEILGVNREVKEQNVSKINPSEKAVKEVTDKCYSFDTNVRGQTSEEVKSSTASSVNIESKVFTEKEKTCSSVSASSKAIEKGSTKHIPSKSYKVDMNASSQGKKVENPSRLSKYELYCRGGTGDGKCNVFVCSLSEIRLLWESNHVYNEFYWNWSKINVKVHHDEKKKKYNTKKIYCEACGADWGNTFKRYPCLKLKNFIVRFPNGERKAFSQWKLLDVSIPPIENQ